MQDEKLQLLYNVETEKSIAHPDDLNQTSSYERGDLNKSDAMATNIDPFTPRKDIRYVSIRGSEESIGSFSLFNRKFT